MLSVSAFLIANRAPVKAVMTSKPAKKSKLSLGKDATMIYGD
jgi:hypothetical protein